MITIENTDGRLSAWGKYSDVKWIYWRKLPKNLPKTGGVLDLTGSIIEAEFDDGTTATVTEYCTFSPADGTSIPADATNINVTAFYPARNGKTYESPVELPIIHPYALQIVTDANYKPKKNIYNTSSPLFDSDLMPVNVQKFSTYCLYTSGTSPDIIYAEKVENPAYTYEGLITLNSGGIDYIALSADPRQIDDATVYHAVGQPSVESFANALVIKATATVDGVSLSATSYLETDPVDYFILRNEPHTTGDHEINKANNISFHYASGAVETPVANFTDYALGFSLNQEPTIYNYFNSRTITFTDNTTGALYLSRDEWGVPRFSFTKYNFTCSSGLITWQREEES